MPDADATRVDCPRYLVADLVVPDRLVTESAVPIHFYREGFGS